MRLLFSGILILLISTNISAQRYNFPSERWHAGGFTLNDGSRFQGSIKYDLEADAIQVIIENKTLTYAANQIKDFRIFQQDIGTYRTFYSIPYVTEYGYKRPKFFELIYEGNTSLLAREFISITTRSNAGTYFRGSTRFVPYGNSRSLKVRFLDHNLYLVSPEGEIELLSSNRKDVIYAFDGKHAELRKFIKKQKIKVDRIEDVKSLVVYYNQLENL